MPLTTTLPLAEPAGDDIEYELPPKTRRLPLRYWNHWWASSAGTGDPGRRLGEGCALGAGDIMGEVTGVGLGAELEVDPLLQEMDRAAVPMSAMNVYARSLPTIAKAIRDET